MMTMSNITSINNNNMQTGRFGTNMQTDSVSKSIQKQIENAQERLRELSSNKEISLEEKMKKRQEIQQEITSLEQQLRQHQIEQRKEQQPKDQNDKGTALSQAMISADFSLKQAKVQGSMATQMKGKAGVLASEIKMDKGRGGNTEKQEEELADLQARTQAATEAQISTLADAGQTMKEAAKTDQIAETENKKEETNKTAKGEEKSDLVEEHTADNINNKGDAEISDEHMAESTTKPFYYTSVDIRL